MKLAAWIVAGGGLLALVVRPAEKVSQRVVIGSSGEAQFVAFESGAKWGLGVTGAGLASVTQAQPVGFEFYERGGNISASSTGYDRFTVSAGFGSGLAYVNGPGGTRFTVEDRWTIEGAVMELSRKVLVNGTANCGFLSSVVLSHPDVQTRSQVDYFAPGMIYGSPDHLSAGSIGGSEVYGTGGHGDVQIREDRLPAPLFGVHFSDGSALTVLDPTPRGGTVKSDALDTDVRTLVDEGFGFGAVGVHLNAGHNEQGFWFPGSEGEVTYRGNTYPGGHVHEWRRRYHPVRDGLAQQYRVEFRFSEAESFPVYFRNSWRWAYSQLRPPITWQDLAAVRRSLIDLLASQVQQFGDRAGIPNFIPAVFGSDRGPDTKAIFGFTGKNIESAEFLLADSLLDSDATRAALDRRLGLSILTSFVRLRMNPPVGEGFVLATGEPALAIPRDQRVYLRSFSDAMKAALRAYHREKAHGYVHSELLDWTQQFGEWLLTQQNADGGFPRSWRPGSGEVVDTSPQSSYNPIPFLVLLSRETGDPRFLDSGKRAGEFAWKSGQAKGRFVGGTIDNPDVLDKEAGTLSKEAYVSLFEATHDAKWLERACAAADFAETWIYLWNVPMPADVPDAYLHWKKGAPTYGTQLIASGHSLVDEYMAFEVDEYAKLARWTGDGHYMEIARLLLHDTKNMTAVPDRVFDLKGPGWQQEHWSFAPVRGEGLHRGWLPWVATSQLKGIFGLMEFDPALYRQLAGPEFAAGQAGK